MTITIDVLQFLTNIMLMSIGGVITAGSLFALLLHLYQGAVQDMLTGMPEKETKARRLFYCYLGMLAFIMIWVFTTFIVMAVAGIIWVKFST